MYQSRNKSTITKIPNINNFTQRKKNYLTESSCEQIQKVLRKDYFSRLQKASLNNLINYVNEDDLPRPNNANLEEINKKPLKYAAKQILFSDKIRKNNYNWIKKHPRKKKYNETETVNIGTFKNFEEFKNIMDENNFKKIQCLRLKKFIKMNFLFLMIIIILMKLKKNILNHIYLKKILFIKNILKIKKVKLLLIL